MTRHLKGSPPVFKKTSIYPIPKHDGKMTLENMRPISLLEIGAKIMNSILTVRMIKLSIQANHPLVHPLQFGGTKGRQTADALLIWQSILEDAHENNEPLHAVYADVKAAYDSVSPLSKSLAYRRAGLPEDFIRYAADMDGDMQTQVIVPGHGTTTTFTPQKGFKQGDPLSVIGWILFMDPLFRWLDQGLPQATTPCQYTPTEDQAKLNGNSLRDDKTPAEKFHIKNGGNAPPHTRIYG